MSQLKSSDLNCLSVALKVHLALVGVCVCVRMCECLCMRVCVCLMSLSFYLIAILLRHGAQSSFYTAASYLGIRSFDMISTQSHYTETVATSPLATQ